MFRDQFCISLLIIRSISLYLTFSVNIINKKKRFAQTMESGFSLAEREEVEDNKNEKSAGTMMKKVSYMAAPMVAVYLSQYLLQVISMIMAGHLDELSLSSVAIATSLTNVTGFSLLVGFSGALETLCGQAFGAEQFRKIGSYTYSSMICLVLICFPISLLWVYMDKLLELFHQDPLISELACRYSIWLIPALFGCALLQPMTRYFQSQGLVLPLFLSSFGTLCFHIPLCWLLVYKLRFGIVGAALSIGFSLWLNVALLWVFMRDSALYRETSNLQVEEIFSSMKQFISLAIPTAMMTCLEWWSFELLLLLSGLLPNSKLETSVMSICLTTSLLHYVFVDAIGAAASTHVSNELGAGNPKAARAAANAALYLGAFDASFVCITLYSYRKQWAYIFSNEEEVANYATEITPILCLSIFVCSFTSVLSGIARGVGWQSIAGYASIGSYYLVGIPVGSILCFVAKLRGRGLWIGILIGCFVQTMVLANVTFFTNWEQEATKVRDRVLEMTPKGNDETEVIKEDAQVLLSDISENV
ncbi:protein DETOXIFICATION 8-like isoform X1 [Brassica rapa]|uniref:protein DETOXIFICATION 8-like isoform X1 n=2 Tax=Brassica campestris TaxID=3711 RepID=UPI00142D4848|nr:protein DETOXIFICATION 8-like isoform X1 [Brassica rapa]